METHVKILAILNIVNGVLNLMGTLVLIVAFGIAFGAVRGDADAAIALPIIGLTGSALVACTAIMTVLSFVVGFGLLRYRPWARTAGIILSILSLFVIPLGTALGIYGMWVLFSKDGERLFAHRTATA